VQRLRRPAAVNAVTTVAVALAGLTIASWLLHLEFSRYLEHAGVHGRIVGVSAKTLSRIGETGKALALLGAAATLSFGVPGWRARARVTAVIAMAGTAAAHGLAAVYDGFALLVGFFIAALASAVNALTGARGLPGAGPLSVGLAAVVVDGVSLVLALISIALLLSRSARAYLATEPDGKSFSTAACGPGLRRPPADQERP
jgi:hypothetical protein